MVLEGKLEGERRRGERDDEGESERAEDYERGEIFNLLT